MIRIRNRWLVLAGISVIAVLIMSYVQRDSAIAHGGCRLSYSSPYHPGSGSGADIQTYGRYACTERHAVVFVHVELLKRNSNGEWFTYDIDHPSRGSACCVKHTMYSRCTSGRYRTAVAGDAYNRMEALAHSDGFVLSGIVRIRC